MSGSPTPGGRNSVVSVLLALAVVASVVAAVPLAAAAITEKEPNDSFENAQSITPNETVTGVSGTDTFVFRAERGETINFTLFNVEGGSSIAVYDRNENRITGTNTNDNAIIGTTATYTGKYYVAISPRFRSSDANYTFTVRTYRTNSVEPNEDRANASSITPGESVSGEISAGDDDWFRFTAEAGETINLTASLSGAGATNVNVVDRNGNELSQISGSGSTGVTATYTGTYYARLSPDFGNFGQEYNFTVETYRTDAFEPNEDYANATRLYENPFAPDDATVSLGDQDWFAVRLSAGETVRVTANIPVGTGTRLVSIGTPDQSFNSTEVEDEARSTAVVTLTASTSGLYSVVAEDRFGSIGPYNFTVTVDGERLGLPNDPFERGNPPIGNQDQQNATAIDSGRYDDLGMVDDDRDVFAIDAQAGERIVARTFFDATANDLALELVGPGGSVVRTADSSDDGERLDFTATQSGTHYLRVTGESGARAQYDLQLSVLGSVTASVGPGSDRIEPGTTATYDVVLAGVQAGVGSVNFSVTSSDSSVLTVDSVSAAQGTARTRSVAGGLGVNLTDLAVAGQSVTVAQVTVSATAEGSATLSIAVDDLRTQSGVAYGQTTEQGTSLDVSTGPGALPGQSRRPTDSGGDGEFEDVNGDGSLNVIDVSILLGVFDQVPSGETAFYDYNDDGSLNILDVAELLDQT